MIINDTSYVVTKTDNDSTNENEDKELIGVYMMAQVQNVKSWPVPCCIECCCHKKKVKAFTSEMNDC